jgi:uncharacterized Zn-binding protein involved in type VI secretion
MGKGLEHGECTTEELAPEEAVLGWSVAVTGRVTVCGRTLPSGPPPTTPPTPALQRIR